MAPHAPFRPALLGLVVVVLLTSAGGCDVPEQDVRPSFQALTHRLHALVLAHLHGDTSPDTLRGRPSLSRDPLLWKADDVAALWRYLGRAVMEGLGCEGRRNSCGDQVTCTQVIDSVLTTANQRPARHAPPSPGRYSGDLHTYPIRDVSILNHPVHHRSHPATHHQPRADASTLRHPNGSHRATHHPHRADVSRPSTQLSQQQAEARGGAALYDGVLWGLEGQLRLSGPGAEEGPEGQLRMTRPEEGQLKMTRPEEGQLRMTRPEEGQLRQTRPEERQLGLSRSEEVQLRMTRPEEGQLRQTRPVEGQLGLSGPSAEEGPDAPGPRQVSDTAADRDAFAGSGRQLYRHPAFVSAAGSNHPPPHPQTAGVYHHLPPHPQTPWWLLQDSMRGRVESPPSHSGLRPESGGSFQATGHQQQQQHHQRQHQPDHWHHTAPVSVGQWRGPSRQEGPHHPAVQRPGGGPHHPAVQTPGGGPAEEGGWPGPSSRPDRQRTHRFRARPGQHRTAEHVSHVTEGYDPDRGRPGKSNVKVRRVSPLQQRISKRPDASPPLPGGGGGGEGGGRGGPSPAAPPFARQDHRPQLNQAPKPAHAHSSGTRAPYAPRERTQAPNERRPLPTGLPPPQPLRPFNHSAVVARVFFAVVLHNTQDDCSPVADYLAGPSRWAEQVCALVYRDGSDDIAQLELMRLRNKVKDAFNGWAADRFLPLVDVGTGRGQLLRQQTCFNVVRAAETLRPRHVPHHLDGCVREMRDYVTRLSTFTFNQLLQGHRPVTDNQPCPADFIKDIFGLYGTDGDKHVMSVTGVQSILDTVDRLNSSQKTAGTAASSRDPESFANDSSLLSAFLQRAGREDQQRRTDLSRTARCVVDKRFSGQELVDMVVRKGAANVTEDQFYQLCPSLLQQVLASIKGVDDEEDRDSGEEDRDSGEEDRDSGEEDRDSGEEDHDSGEEDRDSWADRSDRQPVEDGPVPVSHLQMYGLGTASVAVLTLCSLFGAMVVKLCGCVARQYTMAAMLALAVGNLTGDAVLHLLPEAFDIGPNHHDNGPDGSRTFTEDSDVSKVYHLAGGLSIHHVHLKGLALLASVYLLWLLEVVACCCHSRAQRAAGQQKESVGQDGVPSIAMATLRDMSEVTLPRQSRDSTSTYEDVSHQYLQTSNKPAAEQQGDSQGNPRHLVWLVVVGDAIHNMADGLAIGAAFAHSITMGLSVSMAVICHELPHELGDLAVLVSTGMTVRKALLLNLLSGLTAFLGLYTGIGLGHSVSLRQWIFVVVAAMFLYIALASLIPELVRYFQLWRNATMFIVQSAGLLSGFLVMVLLVLVETKVHI